MFIRILLFATFFLLIFCNFLPWKSVSLALFHLHLILNRKDKNKRGLTVFRMRLQKIVVSNGISYFSSKRTENSI